jgi:hypothetical protein
MLLRLTPLASCLATALALALPLVHAANRTVTNCSDSGAGSLRLAIAGAASSGDTIVFDTAQMACSTITLTSGQIAIDAEQITLQGPGAGLLTISGGYVSRVFRDAPADSLDYNRKLTINNLTIADGRATVAVPTAAIAGGCIYSSGDVTLSASTVTNCVAEDSSSQVAGGAVWSNSLHVLQGSTISDSQANGFGVNAAIGGGAYVRGQIVVSFSTISGNSALGSHSNLGPGIGGGLASFGGAGGDVQISSSTISGNNSDFGGGLYLSNGSAIRAITIDRSAIFGNHADVSAGGVQLYDGSSNAVARIVDSTVSGNNSSYWTGGVANFGAALTISNSTIVFNAAQSSPVGSAIAAGLNTTAATLQSSLIAKNLDSGFPSDLGGGVTMLGSGNLIMATRPGTTAPAATLTGDPLLGTLMDNGGPTLTRALLNGSPAIGTGNNPAHLGSDQRGPGFARSTNGKTDIGAFQTGDGIFYSGLE